VASRMVALRVLRQNRGRSKKAADGLSPRAAPSSFRREDAKKLRGASFVKGGDRLRIEGPRRDTADQFKRK
jgi:hypothetical protein